MIGLWGVQVSSQPGTQWSNGGQLLITFKADPILRLSLLASFLRGDLLSACCTTADPPLRDEWLMLINRFAAEGGITVPRDSLKRKGIDEWQRGNSCCDPPSKNGTVLDTLFKTAPKEPAHLLQPVSSRRLKSLFDRGKPLYAG